MVLIGAGFVLNLAIVYSKGYSLQPLVLFFNHSGYVARLLCLLIIGYQVTCFVIKAVKIGATQGINGIAALALNLQPLKIVCIQSALVFIVMYALLAFQTSFKTIYNQALLIPNMNDWILYTVDQQIGLQQVTLWFFYGASQWFVQSLIVLLDVFYMPSFALQWLLFLYIAFNDPLWQRRSTFVACFIMIWIMGTTLGGICQSGGPFFFSVASNNLLLMNKINQINQAYPLSSVLTQSVLWENYFDGSQLVGLAVSAFPSLHVAMSMFVLLYAYERQCCIWVALPALVLTWLASALLGWHYWVDGIGAFFLVAASYRLVLWFSRFFSFEQ